MNTTRMALSPDDAQRLENLMISLPALLHEHRVPGVSFALFRGDSPITAASVGVADAGRRIAMSKETLFPAASLGKPLAAFLALRLAQGGLIDPDRALMRHLKPDHAPEYAGAAGCTLHQVLSHCSGLPNWRRPGEALTADIRYTGRFRYSGEGYLLAQRVMEAVSGYDFETLMQRELFQPLGLQHLSFRWLPPPSPGTAAGHDPHGQPVAVKPWLEAMASHTLYATPTDYAHFLRFFLSALKQPGHPDQAVCRQMTKSRVTLSPGLSWGSGFSVAEGAFGPCLWHIGNNIHHVSLCLLDIKRSQGLVVMSNGIHGHEPIYQVVQALFGAGYSAPEWVQRFYASFRP
jgi:CubicO group peptidase (beta-lactamase class C family)